MALPKPSNPIFSLIMDTARVIQDGVIWLGADGHILGINEQLAADLGYRKETFAPKTIFEVNPTMSIRSWKKLWKQLLVDREFSIETEQITADETIYPAQFRGVLLDIDQVPICMGIVVEQRSKPSKKISVDELTTLAKYAVDQSIDMIYWLNPDGTFKYFNDAFVIQTGYARTEIEQMVVTDFFPETDLDTFITDWLTLEKKGIIQNIERQLQLKNKHSIPTEITTNLVKIGTTEYSSTILRDISARKKVENETQQYLKEIETLQHETAQENIFLKEEINLDFSFTNIISRDPNYKKVLRQVEQVADTDATVLILGETGTGKELLARAVHDLSDREDKPMIKINCGTLPENLIESELFGHEKGAFTGAYQQKIGKFERAHNGTIFLDEIGELPLDLQPKLLRVLQEGEIERIGGTKVIKVDVRVIAATNRDLEDQVTQSNFREDLFYRLNVFPIYNIPLRERREDIPLLVKYFTEKYSKRIKKEISEISQISMNKLIAYDFLGNVRELQNMVERAIILNKGKVLSFDMVLNKKNSITPSKFKTMEAMQKQHIIDALKRTNGKISGKMGAAVILDMNDRTLTSRMKKLNINKQDYLK